VSETIVTRVDELPEDFERLRAGSEAEGFGFLNRLKLRWRVDSYDEDALASVFAAYVGGELAAIGAQTFDEYDPGPLQRRLRHFCVLPTARRDGVRRALANALIHEAFQLAPRLRLRATHDVSRAFWEAIGFRRVNRPWCSHEMLRDAP
jgi:GNAT superfamily N-acetyltransferase